MGKVKETIRNIKVEEFIKIDFDTITLLDLREPDEVLVDGIEGAINIPFDQIGKKIGAVPKDKPVYVFCRTGDWSEEIAEVLSDRGYEAYNLIGGFGAYREYLKNGDPLHLDAKGLKCPGPIVKAADAIKNLKSGQRILIEATEDAFASDIAVWCDRTGNQLLKLEVKPDVIVAVVQKATKKRAEEKELIEKWTDKTFVVFSGDLDKTIAAFIMANGAAAMGRKVTLYFTFWGLNILRKSEKVKVKKTLIEKVFGFMMPRGTKQLGLSRMNMGGIGAKMIRGIMRSKNVASLEELIQSAIDHGVRLVACQMAMDIMGIHKEELIDGVELGGVSTFLGSGETSDMSLFI